MCVLPFKMHVSSVSALRRHKLNEQHPLMGVGGGVLFPTMSFYLPHSLIDPAPLFKCIHPLKPDSPGFNSWLISPDGISAELHNLNLLFCWGGWMEMGQRTQRQKRARAEDEKVNRQQIKVDGRRKEEDNGEGEIKEWRNKERE